MLCKVPRYSAKWTFIPSCGYVDADYQRQQDLVVSLTKSDICELRKSWNPENVDVVYDRDAEAEPGAKPWQFCFTEDDLRYTHMQENGLPWHAIHEDDPANRGMRRLIMRQWPMLVLEVEQIPRWRDEKQEFCDQWPMTLMLEKPRSLTWDGNHWGLWIGGKKLRSNMKGSCGIRFVIASM